MTSFEIKKNEGGNVGDALKN